MLIPAPRSFMTSSRLSLDSHYFASRVSSRTAKAGDKRELSCLDGVLREGNVAKNKSLFLTPRASPKFHDENKAALIRDLVQLTPAEQQELGSWKLPKNLIDSEYNNAILARWV